MTDYSALSEDRLIELVQQGDNEAGSELSLRYRPLIKKCTRPFFLIGGDEEDLIQEGMMGLVTSMQTYSPDRQCSFKSYAELCIKRRILSAIKAANRQKHMPLNNRLSLDEIYSDDEDTIAIIADDRYSLSPEQQIIREEEIQRLRALAQSLLSSFEKKVLDLYLEGLSYDEIAERTGKRAKSVDSALQRIKKKLSKAANREN
jgi:RNA polymerase sporulation-specific sigma factor